MNPISLGPFELLNHIATGGMGHIYRGRHRAQGVEVAVKVLIETSAREVRFRRAFRREVEAVARLNHPGIISVLDYGAISSEMEARSEGRLVSGSPYLVMEYVRRGSLERLLFPLPWKTLRRILLATLSALAHAHARGLTHRDLKPANVLVADLARPAPIRLTDFGIAHTYREGPPSDPQGSTLGTPPYMAPEQFQGHWRDYGPWTDLYALGCMVFELASDRVPFTNTNVLKLGLAHIGQPPPNLQYPNSYPAGFGRWVERLLEKAPHDRFRCAADAAWALSSLGEHTSALASPAGTDLERKTAHDGDMENAVEQQSETVVSFGRAPLPFDWRPVEPMLDNFKMVGAGLGLYGLRVVPLVDRDRERDELWRHLRSVAELGTSKAIVIDGPAGIGKSRLARWLTERAYELGASTVLAAEHSSAASAGTGLPGMFTRFFRCMGMKPDKLQGRLAEVLGRFGLTDAGLHAALARFLAPVKRGSVGTQAISRRVRARSEQISPILTVLAHLASERPVVIWLDDVQWGLESLELVELALRSRRRTRAPILFVLTVRRDDLVDRPLESRLLARLSTGGNCTSLRLGPLEAPDRTTLTERLLHLDYQTGKRLAAQSGGNPLFAIQLVGDWVRRNILVPETSGFTLAEGVKPEIPDDLHTIWHGRVQQAVEEIAHRLEGPVSPLVKKTQASLFLEIAAVLGEKIDETEWHLVCDAAKLPEHEVSTDVLVNMGLAEWTDQGWRLIHTLLRDSILRVARDNKRLRQHHLLIADVLRQQHAVPVWGISGRLGRHYQAGGQFEDAARFLLDGAKEHARLGEVAAALELLSLREQALARLGVPSGDPARLAGWLLEADIRCAHLSLDRARTLAEKVLHQTTQRSGPVPERGEALLILAQIARHEDDLERSIDLFQDAQTALEAQANLRLVADCLHQKAQALLDADLPEKAWSAFERASELYRSSMALFAWAENELGRALTALRLGDVDLASSQAQGALGFARREGHKRLTALAQSVLGRIEHHSGQLDAALEHYQQSALSFDAMGLHRSTLEARINIAFVLRDANRPSQAREVLREIDKEVDNALPDDFASQLHALSLALAADETDESER